MTLSTLASLASLASSSRPGCHSQTSQGQRQRTENPDISCQVTINPKCRIRLFCFFLRSCPASCPKEEWWHCSQRHRTRDRRVHPMVELKVIPRCKHPTAISEQDLGDRLNASGVDQVDRVESLAVARPNCTVSSRAGVKVSERIASWHGLQHSDILATPVSEEVRHAETFLVQPLQWQDAIVASNRKVVHGDDLLYRFFQSALIDENAAFAAIPQLLLATMGIWLPLDVYAQWPVVLPWVVRDPSCRGRKSAGLPDQWSSPNKIGLLRDDNSMIKSFPRALPVASPGRAHLHGARMGTEFVAAHVWRTPIETEVLASRLPQLNSFVPNLVWLPGQIAKLTDREGSVVQETLQAMSWAIYRTAHVDSHLRDIVEEAWNLLPRPSREISDIDSADLNWFVSTPCSSQRAGSDWTRYWPRCGNWRAVCRFRARS